MNILHNNTLQMVGIYAALKLEISNIKAAFHVEFRTNIHSTTHEEHVFIAARVGSLIDGVYKYHMPELRTWMLRDNQTPSELRGNVDAVFGKGVFTTIINTYYDLVKECGCDYDQYSLIGCSEVLNEVRTMYTEHQIDWPDAWIEPVYRTK